MQQFLGKYPAKSLHKIIVVLLGIWLTTNGLNYIWQNPNQHIYQELKEDIHLEK